MVVMGLVLRIVGHPSPTPYYEIFKDYTVCSGDTYRSPRILLSATSQLSSVCEFSRVISSPNDELRGGKRMKTIAFYPQKQNQNGCCFSTEWFIYVSQIV